MKRSWVLPVLFFISSFILYGYKLPESFLYNPDFARDLYFIAGIIKGHLTLIGPKLTFGGIYTGPWYFYLLAPVFFITRQSIEGILYFNVFLFSCSLAYFAKKINELYPAWKTVLATTTLMTLPLCIISARNPSNAFTYLSLFLIVLTYIYFNGIKTVKECLMFGFLFSVFANFHPITMSVIFFLMLGIFQNLTSKIRILYMLCGFIIGFLPLLAFELKHGFVMIKNTFVDKSYLSWVNNKNIPGGLSGKKNVLQNGKYLADLMQPFIAVHPFIYILGAWVSKRFSFIVLTLMGCFVFISLFLRGQLILHYLFPVAFFTVFVFIFSVLRSRLSALLIIPILASITMFPKGSYERSVRTYPRFEKAVRYAIDHNLVKKGERFNILQITEPDLLAPIAFEYRYFFRKYGYESLTEFEYKDSPQLLVFSEKKDETVSDFSSWETREFGQEHFANAQKYTVDGLTIYKIVK